MHSAGSHFGRVACTTSFIFDAVVPFGFGSATFSAHNLVQVRNDTELISRVGDFVATSASQSEHEVQCALFLNVVVGERSAVFELLASKDQSLLIRRNALLVLLLFR